MTSRAVTRLLGTSRTPAMLRAVSVKPSSCFTSMTSVLPVDAERLEHRGGRLGLLRPPALERVDDDERAVGELLRERRAQRAELHLRGSA